MSEYDCPEGYPTCSFGCRWWREYQGPRTEATPENLERIRAETGCYHPKLSRERKDSQLVGAY